jgi:glutamine synthetase
VLKPDLDTAFVDPFCAVPTVSCFASMFDPLSGTPYERDPRSVLSRAVAELKQTAKAPEVRILPEFEFYLFNNVSFANDATSSVYRIESDELRHDDRTGLSLYKGVAYEVAPPFDRSSDFRSELAGMMAGVGLPVKYHHHEGGRYSQVEVEPLFIPVERAGDAIMLVKYLVRNLAFRHGKTATFMPKPLHGEPGSGLHLHIYLADSERSLFADPKRPGTLSELGGRFVGGIMQHAPSLCALTNPSTNSYRRLVPGFEAPVAVFFSVANRTAAIRIPGYSVASGKMAIEYRIPDATANPYLALAAILMAGRDGVLAKLDPGLPRQGRVESGDELAGARHVPTSLSAALLELRADRDYLVAGGVFPADLLDRWVEMKFVEVDAVAKRPHPWEYELYYGC